MVVTVVFMCPGLGAVLVVCLSVFDQCIHVARAVKQPYTRCGVICGVFYVCERGISGSCCCCTACYYCFIRRPLVFVAGVYVRSFVCARVEGASGCGLLIPWPLGGVVGVIAGVCTLGCGCGGRSVWLAWALFCGLMVR